jgi:hypothetical protein
MPSKKASRYGSRAEKKLAAEYNLTTEGVHTSWKDAEFQNGVPVEIKAAQYSTGYFQIYKTYHEKIKKAGGYYGFVVYKPWGTGIRVLSTKMTKPRRVPVRRWSPTNHADRQSEKARIPFEDVF